MLSSTVLLQAKTQTAITVRAPKNVRLVELINKVERENAPPPIKPKPGQPPTPTSAKPPSLPDKRNAAPQSGELPDPPQDIRRKPSTASTSGRLAAPGVSPKPGYARTSSSHRPSIPPPPPPPPQSLENSATAGRDVNRDSALPPPPPSPPAMNGAVQSGGGLEEMDVMPPPPIIRPSAKRGTDTRTDHSFCTFWLTVNRTVIN